MKITVCENRFEVVVKDLGREDALRLIEKFQDWVLDKQFQSINFDAPTDEDYLAAMGPCGK